MVRPRCGRQQATAHGSRIDVEAATAAAERSANAIGCAPIDAARARALNKEEDRTKTPGSLNGLPASTHLSKRIPFDILRWDDAAGNAVFASEIVSRTSSGNHLLRRPKPARMRGQVWSNEPEPPIQSDTDMPESGRRRADAAQIRSARAAT